MQQQEQGARGVARLAWGRLQRATAARVRKLLSTVHPLGLCVSVVMGITVGTMGVSCATGSGDGGEGAAGIGGAAATGGGGGAGGAGGGLFDGGLEEGGQPPPLVLYAHDSATLFQADPAVSPLSLSFVGMFDCVGGAGQDGSMTDLAVSGAGEIWGVSADHVHRLEIQGTKVHCAQSIPLNNPSGISFYGLTFAPRGVLSPDQEVLIAGNTAGELWSIDAGGNLARRGTFGVVPADDGRGHAYANAGKLWELSGDIAFAENNGVPIGFATVRDCPNPPSTTGCNTVDTLIEIDVPAMQTATTGAVLKSVRGQIVKRAGCNDGVVGDYGSMYGIGIFADRVFGMSRFPDDMGGYAVDISNVDGTACLIQAYPTIAWYGAGITTLVPVEPPN